MTDTPDYLTGENPCLHEQAITEIREHINRDGGRRTIVRTADIRAIMQNLGL